MLEKITSYWFTSPKKAEGSSTSIVTELNPRGLKPCCACPITKSARDDCFFKTDASEADEKCRDLVEQHLACMRGYGFKI